MKSNYTAPKLVITFLSERFITTSGEPVGSQWNASWDTYLDELTATIVGE